MFTLFKFRVITVVCARRGPHGREGPPARGRGVEKGAPGPSASPGRAEHDRTRLQPHEAPPQSRYPPRQARRDLPRQPPAHPHRHPPESFYNYITNEVTELEELMEIKQLIQRQKLERMMKVHKEMRGLDRYREQPKEYKYHDPYDDWIFRQLADIDNRNNIPDTSPQLDFNEADYDDYLKEKWNRGL